MRTQKLIHKKGLIDAISTTVIALVVSAIVYRLLQFIPNEITVKPLLYALGYSIVFFPVIFGYIRRAIKNDEFIAAIAYREVDESEERYRVLVENSPAGILSCDRDGNITTVNDEVVKLLGSPSAEATKAVNLFNFESLIKIGVSAKLKQCMETGEVYRGESYYVTKWGKKVYLRMTFAPLHDYNRAIIGVQVSIEDFTDYKKAQDQLRTYYQAMEHSPVAVIISGADGRIEYINPKYTELTGYSSEELLGKHTSMLYQNGYASQVYEEMRKSVSAGKVWQKEFRNLKKNGEHYWENISISPVLDADGKISHYVGIKEDITERRKESEKTSYMAYHDSLTRLPNRELFHDRVILAAASADRFNTRMALMYMDLDGFKKINDAYGHDVGDDLLKAVADKLSHLIRKGDTVARLGGDEFALLIPEFKEIADLEIVAKKILTSLREPLTARKFEITVSIGISLYPEHGKIFDLLLKNADQAMYQAKKLGKNNYQIYGQ
ncbi:sensor domain-containing diguanylate cyclase [Eubacteriaceae bacterium ES2]|nr:sensor domain-containing diguanylate cyclase [Eubacteriaceae bacterium ES2]